MKRVKAACIFQTLIFAQKPEMGYSKERALQINKEEVKHYKATFDRAKTRYQIIDTVEQEEYRQYKAFFFYSTAKLTGLQLFHRVFLYFG